MRSFPFAAYTVRTMTIERPSEVLKHMLTSRGYRFLCGGSTGALLCLSLWPPITDLMPSLVSRRVLGTRKDDAAGA